MCSKARSMTWTETRPRPSFVLVENRGEDAWRLELRQAAPVDRTIHAHQRDRVQVADDAVGLDRLIGHSSPAFQRVGLKRGRDHSRHSDRKSQFQAGPGSALLMNTSGIVWVAFFASLLAAFSVIR